MEAVAILNGTPSRILGVFRGDDVDSIRSTAGATHAVNVRDVTVIAAVIPRTPEYDFSREEALRKLRRIYQHALTAEDGDFEDVAALVEVFRRIRALGGELPAADVRAMEAFMRASSVDDAA